MANDEFDETRPNWFKKSTKLYLRCLTSVAAEEHEKGNTGPQTFLRNYVKECVGSADNMRYNRMEIMHLQELIDKQLSRVAFRNLRFHPAYLSELRKSLLTYNFWIKNHKRDDFEANYNMIFHNNWKAGRVQNRITRIQLSAKVQKDVEDVVQSTKVSYDDTPSSHLELSKNLLCHTPFWPQIEHKERIIGATIPEIYLQIFTYCVEREIDMDEFCKCPPTRLELDTENKIRTALNLEDVEKEESESAIPTSNTYAIFVSNEMEIEEEEKVAGSSKGVLRGGEEEEEVAGGSRGGGRVGGDWLIAARRGDMTRGERGGGGAAAGGAAASAAAGGGAGGGAATAGGRGGTVARRGRGRDMTGGGRGGGAAAAGGGAGGAIAAAGGGGGGAGASAGGAAAAAGVGAVVAGGGGGDWLNIARRARDRDMIGGGRVGGGGGGGGGGAGGGAAAVGGGGAATGGGRAGVGAAAAAAGVGAAAAVASGGGAAAAAARGGGDWLSVARRAMDRGGGGAVAAGGGGGAAAGGGGAAAGSGGGAVAAGGGAGGGVRDCRSGKGKKGKTTMSLSEFQKK